jgi:pimeloyl-ACP methyl ester carboxylesterase
MVRSIFLLLGILVVIILVIGVGYPSARLLGLYLGSHVVNTSSGPVEIARLGEGPPVLIVHGLMGGYDQGLLMSDDLVRNGFEVIAVSRPGYLRTPLSTGATPQEQGDALAALLDALKIRRVAVMGISAGGMSSIELAVRHPDRVSGLILLSAVEVAPEAPRPPASMRTGLPLPQFHPFKWNMYALLGSMLTRINPQKTLVRTLDVTTTPNEQNREDIESAVLGNRDRREFLDRLVDSVFPVSGKVAGIRNDLAQISALKSLPLEQITVPTLIIHGESDRILPYSGAVEAQRRIAGSILLPVPGGGHLVMLGPHDQEVDDALLEFCRRVEGK